MHGFQLMPCRFWSIPADTRPGVSTELGEPAAWLRSCARVLIIHLCTCVICQWKIRFSLLLPGILYSISHLSCIYIILLDFYILFLLLYLIWFLLSSGGGEVHTCSTVIGISLMVACVLRRRNSSSLGAISLSGISFTISSKDFPARISRVSLAAMKSMIFFTISASEIPAGDSGLGADVPRVGVVLTPDGDLARMGVWDVGWGGLMLRGRDPACLAADGDANGNGKGGVGVAVRGNDGAWGGSMRNVAGRGCRGTAGKGATAAIGAAAKETPPVLGWAGETNVDAKEACAPVVAREPIVTVVATESRVIVAGVPGPAGAAGEGSLAGGAVVGCVSRKTRMDWSYNKNPVAKTLTLITTACGGELPVTKISGVHFVVHG